MEEKTGDVIEVQEDTKLDDTVYKEVRNPYGFVYITTNLVNGKRYLGKRTFTDKWQKYLGSGTMFKRALKKYKIANFHRNIVAVCYSDEELNQAEYELSVFLNVVESDDWYNMVYGGKSTTGFHHSEETKQKLREHNLGKTMPQDIRKKIGQSLSKTMRGRTFSDEHKQHIRETKIGLKNPGYRVVYCVELDEIFWSAKAAKDKYGIDSGSICKCCRGTRRTIGKHPISGVPLRWRYAYDFTTDDGVTIQGAVSLGYITENQINEYLDNIRQEGNDTYGKTI